MARARRCFPEGYSVHVIQRGLSGMRIVGGDRDRRKFLRITATATARCDVSVHAFVLMDTHFHLIATPESHNALPLAMQKLESDYTRYFNGKYGRTGTIWNSRYRSHVIHDARYWLTCLRYIEQNPVRAHMVTHPEDHRWSSYRTHAFGDDTFPWLTEHRVYQQLGDTPEERQAAYRAICGVPLDDAELRLQRRPPPRREQDDDSEC